LSSKEGAARINVVACTSPPAHASARTRISALAALMPARKATRIDPIEALRD
jgi:hypothetical protein